MNDRRWVVWRWRLYGVGATLGAMAVGYVIARLLGL